MTLTDLKAVFVIEPDWGEKVVLSHTWLTGIQRSILGIEKRSAYSSRYRLNEQFSFTPYDYSQIAWLERNLSIKQHQIWGMPIFPDYMLLENPITALDELITMTSTSFRHWRDFGILINPTNWASYEVFTILSVSATQLTTSAIIGSWPAGTLLFPLFAAKMKNVIGMDFITTRLARLTIEAEEIM